jgi:hypothetical protein
MAPSPLFSPSTSTARTLLGGVPARQAELTAFPSTSTMSPGHGQKHTLRILCNPRSPQLGRSSLHSPCWLALSTEYAADEGQIFPTEHDENKGAVTLDELLHAQSRDEACKRLISVHPQQGIYYVDNRGLLVRISPSDGARQVGVPPRLIRRISCNEHYPVFCRTPRGTKNVSDPEMVSVLAYDGG